MRFFEYGDSASPILLLIHGFQSPFCVWDKYIEHYANDFHLVVPILDGHDPDSPSDFISFEKCAAEIEEYLNGREVYAVYAMSMGGVLAATLLKRGRVKFKKAVLESSPLLSYNPIVAAYITRFYLSVTQKTKKRDEKTLKNAARLVRKEQYDDFIRVLDNMSDATIRNCISGIKAFKLPTDLDLSATELTYIYGGKEVFFGKIAKFIKKHYPHASIIKIDGKGHCEDALLCPEVRIGDLDKIL